MRTPALIAIALLAGVAHADGTDPATRTLCDHITADKRPILVAKSGSDILWSDKAVFERAARYPPSLAALLAHPAGEIPAPTLKYFHDADAHSAAWRPAKLGHTGSGDFSCELTDGNVVAPVDCRYLAYLQARYPKAEMRVKSPTEPLLFLDRGSLVAMLMPVKRG